MPIYEYRCTKGHTFDVMQRMGDDPVTECTVCGAAVARVFHPPSVHFKGSGFYNTDYGTRKRSREKEASASASKESGSSDAAKSNGSSSSGGSGDSGSAGGSGDSGAKSSEKPAKAASK